MNWIVFVVLGLLAVILFLGFLFLISYILWFSLTPRHRQFLLDKIEEKEKNPHDGG